VGALDASRKALRLGSASFAIGGRQSAVIGSSIQVGDLATHLSGFFLMV